LIQQKRRPWAVLLLFGTGRRGKISMNFGLLFPDFAVTLIAIHSEMICIPVECKTRVTPILD
jgi:hypothetical protein